MLELLCSARQAPSTETPSMLMSIWFDYETTISAPDAGSGFTLGYSIDNGPILDGSVSLTFPPDEHTATLYFTSIQDQNATLIMTPFRDGLMGVSDWSTIPFKTVTFADCSWLFELPSSFLPNVTTMKDMFKSTNISSDISAWDTSQVTDMSNAFYYCGNFNSNLNSWDTSQVTDLNGMFRNCSRFNQDLNNWDVSKVTNMMHMFRNCSDFAGDISTFDTGNVVNFQGMFTGCIYRNPDVTNWNTSKATDMSSMFNQCQNFNRDISGWNTGEVVNMDQMFYVASSFNQDLSGWNVSKVTSHREYDFDTTAWGGGRRPIFPT